MKRSPLRRTAKKTARENRAMAKERKEYAQEHGAEEVHEIVGGGSRHKTKKDRRFWLAVTRELHNVVQYELKARQMARKFLQDPEHFDLDAVNEEYRIGGKDWPITMTQIRDEVIDLLT